MFESSSSEDSQSAKASRSHESDAPENLERVIDLCRRQQYDDVADWLEQFVN